MADTSDIRNLSGQLAKVLVDFQKEIDNGVKKLGSLTKSAEDLGKKMGNWVEPAALLDKALSKISVEQTALINAVSKYDAAMIAAADGANSANNQLLELHELQSKAIRSHLSSGIRLTTIEQERLATLTSQESNLLSQRSAYAVIYNNSKNLKESAEGQLKTLTAQKDTLEMIQAIYMTIMSLGEKYDKMLSEEAKAQGTTKDEIDGQYNAIQKINNGLGTNLASNQEILKSVTSLRKEYSLTDSQLASIGKESANISRLTGLTVDEATKFQTSLAEIGGTSIQTQEAMTAIASKAAEAAGVPMGQVMRDVANVSNGVRLIFKGNTTELIKQAAEARKLGTSLEAMAKSAESLLNFESSIGAELKLSALLGKNVNFNESRRLFFAGDLIGAEKALQKEVEKVGDLDKLNFIQRKALAEATGKDFGELQKIQTQKKNLLEAERMFPKEAAKMKKAQEELKALQKGGLDARKQELQLLIDQKTAEAESAKLAQAKEAALLNIGKILKPVYDIILGIQTFFFQAIASILSFEASWGQVLGAIAIGATVILTAFFTLKYGLSKVLDFLGNMFGKAAQSAGEGLGKGLEGISKGITALGTAVGSLKWSDMAKLAALLVLITGAAIGLGYAMSMLGQTSATQILAFTAALVILGAGLAIIAALMTPPSPLGAGMLIFAGALAITSLAAIGFAKAIQMVTPSLALIGEILTSLGKIVGGVIIKAFDTMLSVFQSLPGVIASVALGLVTIANIGFFKLSKAAAGVSALSSSIKSLGESLVNLQVDRFAGLVSQIMILSESADGLVFAVNSLKELSNIELPKLDMDFKGVETFSKTNDVKEKQTSELKAGLEVVAQKIEILTSMMANGGISVNLDGQRVTAALATTNLKSGGFGQATTRG